MYCCLANASCGETASSRILGTRRDTGSTSGTGTACVMRCMLHDATPPHGCTPWIRDACTGFMGHGFQAADHAHAELRAHERARAGAACLHTCNDSHTLTTSTPPSPAFGWARTTRPFCLAQESNRLRQGSQHSAAASHGRGSSHHDRSLLVLALWCGPRLH